MARKLSLVLSIFLSGCTYGAPVDGSGFDAAQIDPSSKQVVFTYTYSKVRPPTGLSMFPDGGAPIYSENRSLIGIFDLRTGKTTKVAEVDNLAKGYTGSYMLEMLVDMPGHFLVTHSVTPADRAAFSRRFYVLNLGDGKLSNLPDIEHEAERAGFTRPRVLWVAASLEKLAVAGNKGGIAGQLHLYLRGSSGAYRDVDAISKERVAGSEISYWNPESREGAVFDCSTEEKRIVWKYFGDVNRKLIANDPFDAKFEDEGRRRVASGVVRPERGAVYLTEKGGGTTALPIIPP